MRRWRCVKDQARVQYLMYMPWISEHEKRGWGSPAFDLIYINLCDGHRMKNFGGKENEWPSRILLEIISPN